MKGSYLEREMKTQKTQDAPEYIVAAVFFMISSSVLLLEFSIFCSRVETKEGATFSSAYEGQVN